MSAMLDDFQEVRALLAIAALAILTVLVWTHHIGDTAFASCFGAIFACYTAHSLCDDKWPDRR